MHYEKYENDRLGTQLSRALGWFSVALGAAELLAPQQMARLIGVQARDGTTATLPSGGRGIDLPELPRLRGA